LTPWSSAYVWLELSHRESGAHRTEVRSGTGNACAFGHVSELLMRFRKPQSSGAWEFPHEPRSAVLKRRDTQRKSPVDRSEASPRQRCQGTELLRCPGLAGCYEPVPPPRSGPFRSASQLKSLPSGSPLLLVSFVHVVLTPSLQSLWLYLREPTVARGKASFAASAVAAVGDRRELAHVRVRHRALSPSPTEL
jgi:hypothetical protein